MEDAEEPQQEEEDEEESDDSDELQEGGEDPDGSSDDGHDHDRDETAETEVSPMPGVDAATRPSTASLAAVLACGVWLAALCTHER